MIRHLSFLLLAISLAGCRDKPAQPKKAGTFPLQPNPVKVSVRRDSLRTSSATVGPAGGTITAAGSDSTRFTLTIPPKALDGDSTITMTPVSAIEGLPLSGGLVAAVHFEPEGLRFNRPVELRIDPPGDAPVEQQVGLGYLGEGKDLHLYPLDRGRALTMRLLHFSGYGIGLGAMVDLLRLLQPADPRAQLEAQIGALIAADRRLALENDGKGDPQFGTKLSKLFQDYYDHVVLPKIDAAMHTDDWHVMFDAVQTATDFTRISAMLGEEESMLAKLLPLLEPVLVRGFARAYNRCIQKVGGDKEAGMLMIVARNSAMTVFQVAADDPRFSQSKIDKCFAGGTPLPKHLELSFESVFQFEQGGIQAKMTLGSTLKLDQTGGTTTYDTKDWTPLVYRGFELGGSGCTKYTNAIGHDGVWRVSLMVHPDGKIGMTWNFRAMDGVPTEKMTIINCPQGGGGSHDSDARWWWACLNQISSQDVEQAMREGTGYIGLATGMRLLPAPGILAADLKRNDFLCKEGVISLRLKVLP